jgi:hypothetical protein
MKAIINIEDSLFTVAALTKKRLEKKVIEVIKEHIFDPYGVTYSYLLIRGSYTVKSSVTLVDPFDDSGVTEVYEG